MKRCPKCNRTYADDNQKFCTVDGGRLENASEVGTTQQLGATLITNQDELNAAVNPPVPDLNKTMASLPPPPTGEIHRGETGPTSSRTIAASFQPADLPSLPSSSAPPPPLPSPPAHQSPRVGQQPDHQRQPPSQQPPPPAYQQPPPQHPPPHQPQQHQPHQQQQPPPQQQYQQQYQPPPQQQQPYPQPSAPPAAQHAPAHDVSPSAGHKPSQGQHAAAPAARKGSKTPLIIGVVVLLLLASGAAYYFLVLNKKTGGEANSNTGNGNVANANTNTNESANINTNINANQSANANTNVAPPFEPPPDTTQFVNSSVNLSDKIAEHFVPFSFYYPNAWDLNTGIASEGSYFVRAERKLPSGGNVQERFSVGWYESKGTYEADQALFPKLVTTANTNLSKLPNYEKLSEGPTKVNSMEAYEITFQASSEDAEHGEITYWGRHIFLPPGVEDRKDGLQLTILTSSLAPELSGIKDVGVKGELPVILESFRLK